MQIFKLFGSIFLKSDEADKTLDKVDKKAQGLDKTLAKMGKGVTNAGKTMSTWVTGPIVAAGAGILALATKAGNTADRLLDLASITGMSTDAIQEYQYVAKIAGVNTEAITNAAEGFIKRLPQIQAEGGKASEVLQGLGVAVEGTADEIMNNMLVALASIEDPLDRNAKGSQLFGGAWKDLAPILDMGTDGIAKAREEAQKLGIVMDNDALNSANNFRVEMDKLKAMFEAVFLEIGTKFAPLLQDVIVPLVQDKVIPILIALTDKVSKVIDWFASLDGTTQTVILTIVGIVAAIGPLLLIVGKTITIVSKLIPIIKMAGVVIGFLTGPIGLVILAIGALIAIVVLLYKNWDEVSAFLARTWEWIKNTAINIFNAIKDAFVNSIDWIVNKVNTFATVFKSAWSNIWNGAKNTFEGIIEGVKNGFKTGLNWIIDKINDFVGKANGILQSLNAVPGVSVPSIPKIPRLAKGGTLLDNGFAMVGEEGPELISNMKGATVTPLEKAGGITININNPHLFNERDADKLGQLIVGRLRTATGLRV
jgi:hypothetical protein